MSDNNRRRKTEHFRKKGTEKECWRWKRDSEQINKLVGDMKKQMEKSVVRTSEDLLKNRYSDGSVM